MANRRLFLKGLIGAVPAGVMFSRQSQAETSAVPDRADNERSIFKELGITPFINAAAPYSSLSGAPVWPEVIEAMQYAQKNKARMGELHDAVGRRIAALTGTEAAMVSAGATSAMILGTAACLTRTDGDKIPLLPDLTGMKSEDIIQKGHEYSYLRALRNCGVKLIFVDGETALINAINKKTAMFHFCYNYRDRGLISADRFAAIGRKHGIPVFCDAATMLPPADNIHHIVKTGFDMVCFSGGKGLRGPYNGGLLLGRRDLIEAARMNAAPNDEAIGRGMKVSKEVIVGMMVALETSLSFDHDADLEMKRGWLRYIGDQVAKLGGITAEIIVTKGPRNHPNLRLAWDQAEYKITPQEAKQALRIGSPSIEVASLFLSKGHFELSAWMMEPGEEETVAVRISEVLLAAM